MRKIEKTLFPGSLELAARAGKGWPARPGPLKTFERTKKPMFPGPLELARQARTKTFEKTKKNKKNNVFRTPGAGRQARGWPARPGP